MAKPQPGAAETAGGGGIGLDEGLEQLRPFLILQAQAGIGDFESKQVPLEIR